MASPLADLDELILKCRNEKALRYVKESVACYKSGAFRSAIVSTWVAVAFDLIDKIRELSLMGDKEAEKQLLEFESARKSGDISRSLKFEREVLAIARDKLELISHIEFLDLERLQQDRNRCAHPSMTSDGGIFSPPAELSRVHIRNAVEHLLQYPPSQGKAALENLLKEVDSAYFPTDHIKAVTALKNSPLFKARKSLVRNFIIVLLKKLVNDADDYKERSRVVAAIKAVDEIHKQTYNETIQENISGLIRSLPDDRLSRAIPIILAFTDISASFDDDVFNKISNFIEHLPSEELIYLESLLDSPQFNLASEKRLKYITMKEISDTLFFLSNEKVSDKIIKLYVGVNSFERANEFAKTIALYVDDYSKEQIDEIISGAGNNDQIKNSFGVGIVVSAIRKSQKVDPEYLDGILKEAKLNEFFLDNIDG